MPSSECLVVNSWCVVRAVLCFRGVGTSEGRDTAGERSLWLTDISRHSPPCVLNMFALCSSAIQIQRWCREKDFKWTNEACLAAARSGHLDTLKYLVEEGCNLVGEQLNIYNSAARGGHAHVLRYLSECDVVNFVWDSQKAFERAVACNLKSVIEKAEFLAEVLDICEDAYIFLNDLIRFILLGRKHFCLVEKYFVRVRGYPHEELEELATPSMVVDAAVKVGSIYVVDWLMGKGFPCDADTILSYALQFGHVGLLTTLISRGRKWTESSDRRGSRWPLPRIGSMTWSLAWPSPGEVPYLRTVVAVTCVPKRPRVERHAPLDLPSRKQKGTKMMTFA